MRDPIAIGGVNARMHVCQLIQASKIVLVYFR